MNWNPYKRIAHLEDLTTEMMRFCSDLSARLRVLEHNQTADLLTSEEAQAKADKRVRANAAARRYYAKRKAAQS